MRRILAVISIFFAIGAFVLLCLVLPLQINILIPIFMFVIAFMLLMIVKRMDSDETGVDKAKPNELAFYDAAEPENQNTDSENDAEKKEKSRKSKSRKSKSR